MIEFKLPELGENIEQGDLVRLMVAPGATVSAGQSVMELETDKAVVEVPSSVSGTVQEIRVKEGDKIKVGQVIFTVENGAGSKAAEPARVSSTAEAARPQPNRRAAGSSSASNSACASTRSSAHRQHRTFGAAVAASPTWRLPNLSCPNLAKIFRKAIWFA